MTSCGICGHELDGEEVEQRESGDFHRACFDALGAAGVGVSNCADEQTECQLCSRPIAKGAPVVELFGVSCIAHLRCFFGTASNDGHRRSLGAGAARLSTAKRGRALRDQSDALRALSRRLRVATGVGWRPEFSVSAPAAR